MMPENKFNDDAFILSEIKRGEERAFDFIFRKYYKALCAQANLYVKDVDKAQSLVQDCFVKLWDKSSQMEHVLKLSAYLAFMVRNHCLDYLRSLKSESNMHQQANLTLTVNNTEELIVRHEFEEHLLDALAILPQRCREAFEYSRFEHLSYKEIADKMDISVKAVEALLSRSLKILRYELKDYLLLIAVLYRIFPFK